MSRLGCDVSIVLGHMDRVGSVVSRGSSGSRAIGPAQMEIVLQKRVGVDLALLDGVDGVMQEVLDVRSVVQGGCGVVMGLDPVA